MKGGNTMAGITYAQAIKEGIIISPEKCICKECSFCQRKYVIGTKNEIDCSTCICATDNKESCKSCLSE